MELLGVLITDILTDVIRLILIRSNGHSRICLDIDRGISKVQEPYPTLENTRRETQREEMFVPVTNAPRRKPGMGCISEINDHLYEGRWSPKWIDGSRISRNVYATTREECEIKLAQLIRESKIELAERKRAQKKSSKTAGK